MKHQRGQLAALFIAVRVGKYADPPQTLHIVAGIAPSSEIIEINV